jgi:MOSC domain-containing protein YiiM
LAARVGDEGFAARFKSAERPGAYCRVLQEGEVRAGSGVVLEPWTGGERISLLEMFRDRYAPDLREAAVQRYLRVPLASRARAVKERQLDEIRRRTPA